MKKRTLTGKCISLLMCILFLTCPLQSDALDKSQLPQIQNLSALKKYQPINETYMNLTMKAYGFLLGRRGLLNIAKQRFPDYLSRLNLAEQSFEISPYGKGANDMVNFVKTFFKPSSLTYLENQISNGLVTSSRTMNEDNVEWLIDAFSFGNICADEEEQICNVFLDFNDQLANRPFLLAEKQLMKTYYTQGHAKSQGLSVRFEIPKNWLQREGRQRHVLWSFIAKGRSGVIPQAIFQVNERIPAELLNLIDDPNNIFLEKDYVDALLKELSIPTKSVKVTNLGLKPALLIEYSNKQEHLGQSLYSEGIIIMIQYRDYIFQLSCMVSADDKHQQNLKSKYQAFKPLFFQIMNSITVLNSP